MEKNSRICKHCGQTEGEHKYTTDQCPKGNHREVEFNDREWLETTFEAKG